MEYHGEPQGNRDWLREERAGDHYLPTISLTCIAHPKIPNLFQHCFEYLEPWDWSPVIERVKTGQWFYATGPGRQLQSGSK